MQSTVWTHVGMEIVPLVCVKARDTSKAIKKISFMNKIILESAQLLVYKELCYLIVIYNRIIEFNSILKLREQFPYPCWILAIDFCLVTDLIRNCILIINNLFFVYIVSPIKISGKWWNIIRLWTKSVFWLSAFILKNQIVFYHFLEKNCLLFMPLA